MKSAASANQWPGARQPAAMKAGVMANGVMNRRRGENISLWPSINKSISLISIAIWLMARKYNLAAEWRQRNNISVSAMAASSMTLAKASCLKTASVKLAAAMAAISRK
jgi:hypothetical protein